MRILATLAAAAAIGLLDSTAANRPHVSTSVGLAPTTTTTRPITGTPPSYSSEVTGVVPPASDLPPFSGGNGISVVTTAGLRTITTVTTPQNVAASTGSGLTAVQLYTTTLGSPTETGPRTTTRSMAAPTPTLFEKREELVATTSAGPAVTLSTGGHKVDVFQFAKGRVGALWRDDLHVGWSDNSCKNSTYRAMSLTRPGRWGAMDTAIRRGIWQWTSSSIKRQTSQFGSQLV